MENRTARTVAVTIAPETLEFPNGDTLDETLLCDALAGYLSALYPGASVSVDVGYAQGSESYRVNGRRDEDLRAAVLEFDFTDETLYTTEEAAA